VIQDCLASHEAGSREGAVDFAIHITLLEAIFGSHGIFTISHATLVCWHGANLVPVGTVVGSHRACLASHEAVLGS